MPRAIWKDVVVAESPNTEVVEGNHYFPPEAIHAQHFRPSATHTQCGWKGTASYYDLAVGATSPVRNDVVAVISFLWESRPYPDGPWTGTRDLPGSRGKYQKMGFDLLPRQNQDPVGDLNGMAGTILRGWALDPDSPTEHVSVEIRIDGVSYLATADQPRTDVNRGMNVAADHGIEFQVPGQYQDCRVHNAELYAWDTTTGVRGPLIASLCISIVNSSSLSSLLCQFCP